MRNAMNMLPRSPAEDIPSDHQEPWTSSSHKFPLIWFYSLVITKRNRCYGLWAKLHLCKVMTVLRQIKLDELLKTLVPLIRVYKYVVCLGVRQCMDRGSMSELVDCVQKDNNNQSNTFEELITLKVLLYWIFSATRYINGGHVYYWPYVTCNRF